MSNIVSKSGRIIEDPPLARLLFSNTRFAWLFAIIRVLIGLSWLDAASRTNCLTQLGWKQVKP